ncbi:hypothetical protein ACO0RG_003473 [Hanseniaspora osmophila]
MYVKMRLLSLLVLIAPLMHTALCILGMKKHNASSLTDSAVSMASRASESLLSAASGAIWNGSENKTSDAENNTEYTSNDYLRIKHEQRLKQAGHHTHNSKNTDQADTETAKEKQVAGKTVSNLFRRSGTCAFPSHEGMVAVQINGDNAGWAMHSDQFCSYGQWCPYACEPGKLMGQWDPSVTSYVYPGSQNGGLYCDESGTLKKQVSGNDYCYDGKGTVSVQNNAGSDVAFCQTVLPGNEEMLIPTLVQQGSNSVIAVPGPEYWASTAAHYYINPPGVSVSDGCVWGSTANPWGNWAAYVAGANMDSSGNTYVKIGWNPVYFEDSCPYKNDKPSYGLKITCPDGSDCQGLPCSIDPSKVGLNSVTGPNGEETNFCVVTASGNSKAVIEVFEVDSGSSSQKREHHEHKKPAGP